MTHLLEKCPMEKQTNKAGGKWFNKKHVDIDSKAAKTSIENTEKQKIIRRLFTHIRLRTRWPIRS